MGPTFLFDVGDFIGFFLLVELIPNFVLIGSDLVIYHFLNC